jgi:hypothetical protein
MIDMAIKNEVKTILKDVAKGLLSIPFPPPANKKEENIKLHWCEQCQRYHRQP